MLFSKKKYRKCESPYFCDVWDYKMALEIIMDNMETYCSTKEEKLLFLEYAREVIGLDLHEATQKLIDSRYAVLYKVAKLIYEIEQTE